MKISTIGLDLAKNVFTLHGVNERGEVVLRKSLKRAQVLPFFSRLERCLIGMEACGGAHDWGRRLMAMGHDVRLMPASYVKPYIKRGKTDANDAAAICEAVTRPTMSFVPVKTAEQQGVITLHRVRRMLVEQKVMLENSIRSLCAEFGIVAITGRNGIAALQRLSREMELPQTALRSLSTQFKMYEQLMIEIADLKQEIVVLVKNDPISRRLETIPGVGPITASIVPAIVGDPMRFKSGRQFAAWLGLTPRLDGTGGKTKLGPISKRGDRYLRSLFVEGACSVLMAARKPGTKASEWVKKLAARKEYKIAAVALANKNARIAWALMAKGGRYDPARQVVPPVKIAA